MACAAWRSAAQAVCGVRRRCQERAWLAATRQSLMQGGGAWLVAPRRAVGLARRWYGDNVVFAFDDVYFEVVIYYATETKLDS